MPSIEWKRCWEKNLLLFLEKNPKKILENIGKFYTETKELNLNGDRGRIWWDRLTDVRKKEHNFSSPFPLPEFPISKI